MVNRTFTTGTMGSGKSSHLISHFRSLRAAGVHVIVLTTEGDSEFSLIESRDGNSIKARTVTDENINAIWRSAQLGFIPAGTNVFVDEAQWLTSRQVKALIYSGLDLWFYGIEAAQYETEGNRAIELSYVVRHGRLRGTCGFCDASAVTNIRTDHASPLAKNGYAPVCKTHINLSKENFPHG